MCGLHTNDITELLKIANGRQAWAGIIGIAMFGTEELAEGRKDRLSDDRLSVVKTHAS